MEKKRGIDSFTLHILAMLFMLCDHLWATLFPAQEWMTCVGRLAFPIFAFMIAEGCYYTSNVKKYMLRLFLFAIISEIPFNLIMGSSVFYPFHQNVLWTFLLGVLSIQIIEKAKKKQKKWISFFVVCLVLLMDFLLGTITMVDYNAAGILTVLLFYFFLANKNVSDTFTHLKFAYDNSFKHQHFRRKDNIIIMERIPCPPMRPVKSIQHLRHIQTKV